MQVDASNTLKQAVWSNKLVLVWLV